MKSRLFVAPEKRPVQPGDFPALNYLIDDRFDYEGNWAFCRFRGKDVLGARFGFGRGAFDARDYGGVKHPKSFVMLHMELMLGDGAVIWVPNGVYQAKQITSSNRRMQVSLHDNDKEIFTIEGWPNMRWRFLSSDRQAEVDVKIDLKTIFILPDNRMKRNLFAMWVAIGDVHGMVRYRHKRHEVRGTVFYDHPRIMMQRHRVAEFGWNLYTPVTLDDGSVIVAHYTADETGQRHDPYSFACHIGTDGHCTFLRKTSLTGLKFDRDDKPKAWASQWTSPSLDIELKAKVESTGIIRAWGNADVAQTRLRNPNIPLVFNCQASLMTSGKTIKHRGGGLAEFIQSPRATSNTRQSLPGSVAGG